MYRWFLFLSLGLLVFLPACGSEKPVELPDTQWQLRDLAGEAITSELNAPTMRFQSDGKLQGSAGCNSYFTTYETKNGVLTLQVIARTEKTCSPASLMALEDRFMKALGKAKVYSATRQQLQLKSAAGEVLMTLAPLPVGK